MVARAQNARGLGYCPSPTLYRTWARARSPSVCRVYAQRGRDMPRGFRLGSALEPNMLGFRQHA
jgi:hypothetical protein